MLENLTQFNLDDGLSRPRTYEEVLRYAMRKLDIVMYLSLRQIPNSNGEKVSYQALCTYTNGSNKDVKFRLYANSLGEIFSVEVVIDIQEET